MKYLYIMIYLDLVESNENLEILEYDLLFNFIVGICPLCPSAVNASVYIDKL